MKPFFDMSLLIAFGFLSLLLLLGVLLRAKIKFLQNFMVPACLTGGVIGFFILNTTGFPQVQPELYPALAYHFFTISFVCIGLRGMSKVDQSKGSATKEMVRGSIWQAQMFHMGLCSQLILATGIVYLLNALTGRDYLESIGFLAAQGFAAGPGQAISTGLVWEKFGHSGMGQLGMTFAGVGFIVAFAIGVPLVRWGVRKGLNTYPVGSVPEEVKTGPARTGEPALRPAPGHAELQRRFAGPPSWRWCWEHGCWPITPSRPWLRACLRASAGPCGGCSS